MAQREYDSANEWAVYVKRDEPHSLADLQRQLQATAPKVIEKATRPVGERVSRGLYYLVSTLSFIGPIAAVTVFFDRSHALTRRYDFQPGFEFVVAALGFSFGIFFQARMLYRWWNEGRYRDRAAISLSLIMLVFSVGTIGQAYAEASFSPVATTFAMIPAFVTAAACVTVILLSAVAPAKPADVVAAEKQQAAEKEAAEQESETSVDLSALTGDAYTAVLKDRNHALGALDVRGLLKGHDVVELRKRPLGRLIEDGDEPE